MIQIEFMMFYMRGGGGGGEYEMEIIILCVSNGIALCVI